MSLAVVIINKFQYLFLLLLLVIVVVTVLLFYSFVDENKNYVQWRKLHLFATDDTGLFFITLSVRVLTVLLQARNLIFFMFLEMGLIH